MGRRARERVLDEHTYRHRARQLLSLGRRCRCPREDRSRSSRHTTRQGAIGGVVDEIRAFDPEFDVLVVDDCSQDATAETRARPRARVVTLPFNLGIGGAVQTGFKYASTTATSSRPASTATASTTRPSYAS